MFDAALIMLVMGAGLLALQFLFRGWQIRRNRRDIQEEIRKTRQSMRRDKRRLQWMLLYLEAHSDHPDETETIHQRFDDLLDDD